MTDLADRPAGSERHPLSFTQELFVSGDSGELSGPFNRRFIWASAWRIAGTVDVETLQGALDDVVVRHEILRSTVVRDAAPPYQRVHPPCPVPLEVRDLPTEAGPARNLRAEHLLAEVESTDVSVRQLPLLRAVLGRLDERDSVLVLVMHHSAIDGWSIELIMRDLAAFYTARQDGAAPALPDIPQFREYAAWQQTLPVAVESRAYWRERLHGAQVLTVPTDRPVPAQRTLTYSAHNYVMDAAAIAPVLKFARATRSTPFMVLLSAFYVLVNEITGMTDLTAYALTNGRNEGRFQDNVGLFLNFLPLRTDVGGCTSFREIVLRARASCLEAYSHEIPILHLLGETSEWMAPDGDPMRARINFGMFQLPVNSAAQRIADGSEAVYKHISAQAEASDMGSGLAWNMMLLPSGEMVGGLLFNREEFDDDTVIGWVGDYFRILARSVAAPDDPWKT
jgi:non-ribosomal peptide synthetase component F